MTDDTTTTSTTTTGATPTVGAPPAPAAVEETPSVWVTHVLGPDDLLPAESYMHAARQAQVLNAETLAYLARREAEGADLNDPSIPVLWAVPARRADV